MQFSRRIFTLESKTIPPIDSKFNVDSENGVIFEIQRAKFWDIKQNVQHGEFGTPEAYGCQRVKHVLLNSWLHLSLVIFEESFSTWRTDFRRSVGRLKIREPREAVATDFQGSNEVSVEEFNFQENYVIAN